MCPPTESVITVPDVSSMCQSATVPVEVAVGGGGGGGCCLGGFLANALVAPAPHATHTRTGTTDLRHARHLRTAGPILGDAW